ncbi:hypothetical protein [Aeoliella mucimassa]|uniref:Uncharacterized protein n=1 Tax=Aeoliella mucimassa TaxID=2527972 RepID=A0A518AV71_9BACT|nr:hypothetical protein [Aeoliella mucimassa]QDU58624.1 hypothetical protein Pan181_48630 [Aeoliella mucimassa]
MTSRGVRWLLAGVWLISATHLGCSETPKSTPDAGAESGLQDTEPKSDELTARQILENMAAAYRNAASYVDAADYGTHYVTAVDGLQHHGLPIALGVMFQRPNRFLITRIEPQPDAEPFAAFVACDGTTLEGSVSTLEPQRLTLPAPEQATLETMAPDPELRKGLFPGPVRDIFPQLDMLLARPDETLWFLDPARELALLPPAQLEREGEVPADCYRVKIATHAGPHICWIEKGSYLLLRLELNYYRLEAGRFGKSS